MSSNLAKAAVGALALSGGSEKVANPSNNDGPVPSCPDAPLPKFHDEDACSFGKPTNQLERSTIYQRLKEGATGATLVPNQQTIFCPREVQNLESPSAIKGFDTIWIVENTSSSPALLAWVTNGQEWSPFHPDLKPEDDPDATLMPGEWKAVPTFESFVYHAREITAEGPGQVLMQHRAGLVPIGNPNQYDCDASLPDVEPVNPETAERKAEWARTPTHKVRRCNTIDVGFRNQVGCPLSVYWANRLTDVPEEGFTCGERFKFHLGTKPATQDFMHDWESSTKFEGTFIGHTFVARLASNPEIVIDSYTLEPTRIVDCPKLKQIQVESKHTEVVEVVAQGNLIPLEQTSEETILPGVGSVG